MSEVLDVSRDNDTGEVTQFLIIDDNGQPDTKVASPENMLLYDPEDELPFEGGMYGFFSGDKALDLDGATVALAQDEYSYILSIGGSSVETTPEQADRLLKGVYDAIVEDTIEPLEGLHRSILRNQVRRNIVNVLAQTFEERRRITIVSNGWLVDEFYLVDWNANMYAKNDNLDEGDYVLSGTDAVQKDTTYEFVRLRNSINATDETDVVINGSQYTLSEREMLFLGKVKWLLHRDHYHPDGAFWAYVDRWATVEEEEPNLDVFDI